MGPKNSIQQVRLHLKINHDVSGNSMNDTPRFYHKMGLSNLYTFSESLITFYLNELSDDMASIK